jgi:hypothetical protein
MLTPRTLDIFNKVMNAIWCVLGFLCLGLGIYFQVKGILEVMFYLLAVLAFGMMALRIYMQRRRKQQGTSR